MLKLSKSELEKKNRYESKLTQLSTQIDTLINEYNETIVSVNDFVEGIQQRQQEYYDGRSETWLESDRACDYESWKDDWDSFELLEEIECPELADLTELEGLPVAMD